MTKHQTSVLPTTEKVWEEYKEELEKFIRSKVNDGQTADDLLQETFIKIHLNLAKLKDDRSTRAWVYQVTKNTISDHFRKRRLYAQLSEKNEPVQPEQHKTADLLCCLPGFINKLPPKYRDAMILSDIKGRRQTELARKLEISYSGAKSRVQRARNLLRSYITGCCKVIADKYGNIVSQKPGGTCGCAGATQ